MDHSIIKNLSNTLFVLLFLITPLISNSQTSMTNFTYSSFTSNTAGSFAGISITMNNPSAFEQDDNRTWTSSGTLPSGYSNLASRSVIALQESSTTYTKKEITFASNIPTNTLLCLEDIDASEDVRITFKDASGNVINPSSTNITQIFPTSSPPSATTTTSNITLVQSSAGNLSDPVVMLKMNLSTVRKIEIEARNATSGNFGFYFTHPTSNLPVDLIYFDVHTSANQSVDLYWSTASEINNSHFEIERSYDGRTFEIVGKVAGNGNSQHFIEYRYTDQAIHLSENNVFYRLKQIDFDGAFEYSDIRVVRFDRIGESMHLVAYPNPFLDEVTLMVSLPKGKDYSLEITDMKGAKVHLSNHIFTSGVHTLNLAKWNKGIYLVKVVSKQGSEHLKVMKN